MKKGRKGEREEGGKKEKRKEGGNRMASVLQCSIIILERSMLFAGPLNKIKQNK